jgi:hypothetical protein
MLRNATAPGSRERRGGRLQALLLSLPLALSGLAIHAGATRAQPASGSPVPLDAQQAGLEVGRDVARRWCAGEDPKRSVELSMLTYLNSRNLSPGTLPPATMQTLGRETAVEAFAQAFSTCPQKARQAVRTMMN